MSWVCVHSSASVFHRLRSETTKADDMQVARYCLISCFRTFHTFAASKQNNSAPLYTGGSSRLLRGECHDFCASVDQARSKLHCCAGERIRQTDQSTHFV